MLFFIQLERKELHILKCHTPVPMITRDRVQKLSQDLETVPANKNPIPRINVRRFQYYERLVRGLVSDGEPKRAPVRLGGLLTVQEAQDLLDQKAVGEQLVQETRQNSSGTGESRTKLRCCDVCGKPGYNVCTCKEAAELSDSSVPDLVQFFFQCCSCIIQDGCSRMVESVQLACLFISLITHVIDILCKYYRRR